MRKAPRLVRNLDVTDLKSIILQQKVEIKCHIDFLIFIINVNIQLIKSTLY